MNPAKTSASFQPLRGDTVGALELAIAHFESRLRREARQLAQGNLDLADDLYERAITHLWELDPSRFDEDDDGYLWQAMVSRMIDAHRADRSNPTRPPNALRFP